MTMTRSGGAAWTGLLLGLFAAAGWCQDNPYIYVKMPLTVPWTLYFVFLGAVLIPFVAMIVLAWRGPPRNDSRHDPRHDPVPRQSRTGTGG